MVSDSSFKDTILERARREDIQTDPFPHLVVENALPETLYLNLARALPMPTGGSRPNTRQPLPAWVMMRAAHIDPIWARFAERHTGHDILWGVRELFDGYWPGMGVSLPDTQSSYGVLGKEDHSECTVLTDARLEFISPSPDVAGSHRRGHVDVANRIFSALLYFRDPDDDTEGGGLELFRFAGKPPDSLDVFELPSESIERRKTVPYRANTLVLFPNSPTAIHGSEIRGITHHWRTYLFITAEFEDDWFPTRVTETT